MPMQDDLRKKILDYIKENGSVTTDTMKRTFGAEDAEIRETIEYWRSAEQPQPIWLDHHQGYWWSADVEPPLHANTHMGEQMPIGPADQPDAIDPDAAAKADAKWHRKFSGR